MTFTFKHPPETRAHIISQKGILSASEIGTMYGLTRNAVIGIWDRAGAPALTVVQRHTIEKRAKAAAWQRRKAASL